MALASTALAAMFPPLVPHWLHKQASPVSDGGATYGVPSGTLGSTNTRSQAHFVAPPDEAAAPLAGGRLVPDGIDRNGLIPFAGRQIPLPAGNWKDVALGRMGGDLPGQFEFLTRVEDGRLTGLLQATAPSPASGVPGLLGKPAVCSAEGTILRNVAPEAPDQSPMSHECWILTETGVTSAANRGKLDALTAAVLNRAADLGAKVPDRMLLLEYVRSDQSGFEHLALLLPADNDVTAKASRQIQAWAKRYAAALHQGFDSRLPAGGLPASISRDPT